MVDNLIEIARKKKAIPETAELMSWEAIGDIGDLSDRSCRIVLGTPTLKKSGKYKGQKTWKKCTDSVSVTIYEPEIAAHEAAKTAK